MGIFLRPLHLRFCIVFIRSGDTVSYPGRDLFGSVSAVLNYIEKEAWRTIRRCAVQHPWVRSASGRAAPATWHSSRSTSFASIKAFASLSQNNFAKFLTSTLTRMILRCSRSFPMDFFNSWYFYRNSSFSAFVYHDIRSNFFHVLVWFTNAVLKLNDGKYKNDRNSNRFGWHDKSYLM